jgi:predicted NAD-dependent protein-ADP-ribosyltransferase YbiA (DUF1768 family)
MQDVAVIRKVREPFGILGNMSPHRVEYGDLVWRTSEALFQALRFPDGHPVRDLIRAERNPMQAKWCAKSHVDAMCIAPMSEADLENMRTVLRVKYAQHADVREVLESTGERLIVEDCTNRQRGSGLFWGAARPDWTGENWLGRLWMDKRAFERGTR